MVKVSVEVGSGAARFRVSVQAGSIQRAVSLAGGRYPESDIRVKGAATRTEIVRLERSEVMAA